MLGSWVKQRIAIFSPRSGGSERPVIASEAKQSKATTRDWIASALKRLAMTGNYSERGSEICPSVPDLISTIAPQAITSTVAHTPSSW